MTVALNNLVSSSTGVKEYNVDMAAAILTGLWLANGPVWMWLCLGLWWLVLAMVATVLQRRGWAIDTYQAIWGPDPLLPGNRRAPIGIGIRRPNPP